MTFLPFYEGDRSDIYFTNERVAVAFSHGLPQRGKVDRAFALWMRCFSRGERLHPGRRGAAPYPGFVRFAVAVTATCHLERSEAESKSSKCSSGEAPAGEVGFRSTGSVTYYSGTEKDRPRDAFSGPTGEIYEGSPIPHRGQVTSSSIVSKDSSLWSPLKMTAQGAFAQSLPRRHPRGIGNDYN